jgi:iodotyrosine deiodinase
MEIDLTPLALTASTVFATTVVIFLLRRAAMASTSAAPPADCTPQPKMAQAPLKSSTRPDHITFEHTKISDAAMAVRSREFTALMNQRRTLRFFDRAAPPLGVLIECIRCAGTAPSGAHCQPWRFIIVKNDEKKRAIRVKVEAEEQKNYDRRMRRTWVDDCKPLINNLHEGDEVKKPYLTEAPYLVVVMKLTHGGTDDLGNRVDHYYVGESVGIATGLFLAALTNVGLVTLTSTPMGAEAGIREVCGRPDNEKVYLLMPIGFPARDATVPYRDETGGPLQRIRKPMVDILEVQ